MRVFVRFDSVKSPNDKIAEVLRLPRFAYVFLCVQSVVVSVGLTLSSDFNYLWVLHTILSIYRVYRVYAASHDKQLQSNCYATNTLNRRQT